MQPDGSVQDALPEGEALAQVMNDFKGAESPFLCFMFNRFLPLILISSAIIGLYYYRYGSIVFASMVAAVLLTIFFFWRMMRFLPKSMCVLWGRGILADKKMELRSEDEVGLKSSGEEFTTFMADFHKYLNSRRMSFLFGIIFALILFARSIWEFYWWLPDDFSNIILFKIGGPITQYKAISFYLNFYLNRFINEQPLKFTAGFMLEPLVGFFLGLIAWRMLATGVTIFRLDKRFDVFPRYKHPDKCGGLGPLGDICLYNAKIVGVWGALLSIWLILGESYNISFYAPIFYVMLFLLLIIATISFFLPLWGVHQAMLEKKEESEKKLDQIARNINALAQINLNSAYKLDLKSDNISSDLDRLRKIYEDNLNYPVWPFNMHILIALATSQIVPLLGLTGLGVPALNVIKSLLDFFSQNWGP
jgi:hypothetical protein